MSLESTQRIALITGANRGIGLETAKQLAGRGFHVIIAARNEEGGARFRETHESVHRNAKGKQNAEA